MGKHLNSQINSARKRPLDLAKIEKYYSCWILFLDAAGEHAKHFYLLEDLKNETPSPNSLKTLNKYYGGNFRALKLELAADCKYMINLIQKLRLLQRNLGLPGFKMDEKSICHFIDCFTLIELGAPARRRFYRRRVKRQLESLSSNLLTLNDLEAAFKASPSYKKLSSAAAPL